MQRQDDNPEPGTIGALVEGVDADRPAIVAVDATSWNGDALRADVAQIRDLLHSLGIGAGTCVAIVVPNGPLAALAFLGVASVAISAPLNPTTPADELHRLLDDLRAAAIVVPGDATPSTAELVARERGMPVIGMAIEDGRLAVAADNAPDTASGGPTSIIRLPLSDDVAVVTPAPDGTSRPQFVPLTHSHLLTSASAVTASLALTSTDRCCNVMPLFRVEGLTTALLASLHAGGSIITAPGFTAPDVAGWIDRGAATWFAAAPTMCQALVDRLRQDPADRPATRLRFVLTSSAAPAPVPAPVGLEGIETTLGCPLVDGHGIVDPQSQMAAQLVPGSAPN